MKNDREKRVMDFNQSMHFSSTSRQPLHLHNFMSIPSSAAPTNNQREESRNTSFMKELEHRMQKFWKEQMAEVYDSPSVMKSDEQVKMISADTPVVFAKACEMFIMELSMRAWMHTQENRRRTLQPFDNHPGVYVPAPVRGTPAYPVYHPIMNMQSMNQDEVAPEGPPRATNHRSAFPMNFSYNMNNRGASIAIRRSTLEPPVED
ncbi:nuclear factor Y, partial [Striga asiatica]